MGRWVIMIEGVGAHHNGLDSDADALARAFATTLKTEGHALASARFQLVADSEDLMDLGAKVTPDDGTVIETPGVEISLEEQFGVETGDASYLRMSDSVPLEGYRAHLPAAQQRLHDRLEKYATAKGLTAVDVRIVTVEQIGASPADPLGEPKLLIYMDFRLQ